MDKETIGRMVVSLTVPFGICNRSVNRYLFIETYYVPATPGGTGHSGECIGLLSSRSLCAKDAGQTIKTQ